MDIIGAILLEVLFLAGAAFGFSMASIAFKVAAFYLVREGDGLPRTEYEYVVLSATVGVLFLLGGCLSLVCAFLFPYHVLTGVA